MITEARWSEPALLSLAEVLHYTIEKHGEEQCRKLRKKVKDAVQRITAMPYMCAAEPSSDAVGAELRGCVVIPKSR